MTKQDQYRIDRNISIVEIFLASLVVYCILVPISWCSRIFGKGQFLLLMMYKVFDSKIKYSQIYDLYTPTEHDVFVSTFAKSGTNWMLQMCYQIACQGEGEFEHIHDVIPWPEMNYLEKKKAKSISLFDTKIQLTSPERLRVIKTHFSAKYVPYNNKAHYIVVIRDPKEVFVSSYFFVSKFLGPIMPKMDVWLELYLTDRFFMNFGSNWAQHTASYWKLRHESNVLILSYSEMKGDLSGAVQQVAETMGVALTSSGLAKVIEKSSFDYMKKIDHKFIPMPERKFPWMKGQSMMRKGKEGVSSEILSMEQQIRIDEYFQKELNTLQSDFPYSEYCKLPH